MDSENSGIPATMLVGPTGYGNGGGGFGGGFGNDWGWIILLLLFAGGGWGGGFGGGYGNMMLGYDFPWLLNGQQGINNNVSGGFRDAMIHDSITSIGDKVVSGFGDISTQLCNGFNGTQMSILQSVNGLQAQLAQCCCDNRLATCQTQNIVQSEGNATRFADANNTRDIIESQTRGTQAILDKLCSLELENAKREASDLRQQLNMAQLAASQTAQNAFIAQGFANEVDALYNRLSQCPVPSTPVFGRTPIFTCNNNGCGCGCVG